MYDAITEPIVSDVPESEEPAVDLPADELEPPAADDDDAADGDADADAEATVNGCSASRQSHGGDGVCLMIGAALVLVRRRRDRAVA